MRTTLARWFRGIAARLDPPSETSLEDSYHEALLESMDRATALGDENDRLRNALTQQALAFEETLEGMKQALDEANTVASDAVDTLRREGIPFAEWDVQ